MLCRDSRHTVFSTCSWEEARCNDRYANPHHALIAYKMRPAGHAAHGCLRSSLCSPKHGAYQGVCLAWRIAASRIAYATMQRTPCARHVSAMERAHHASSGRACCPCHGKTASHTQPWSTTDSTHHACCWAGAPGSPARGGRCAPPHGQSCPQGFRPGRAWGWHGAGSAPAKGAGWHALRGSSGAHVGEGLRPTL